MENNLNTSGHSEIKVFYNNSEDETRLWKVIVNNNEHFFSEIEICVFSKALKECIECTGWCVVDGTRLVINPFPTDKDVIL